MAHAEYHWKQTGCVLRACNTATTACPRGEERGGERGGERRGEGREEGRGTRSSIAQKRVKSKEAVVCHGRLAVVSVKFVWPHTSAAQSTPAPDSGVMAGCLGTLPDYLLTLVPTDPQPTQPSTHPSHPPTPK